MSDVHEESASRPIAIGHRNEPASIGVSVSVGRGASTLLSASNEVFRDYGCLGKYQWERGIRRKHAAVVVAAVRYNDRLVLRLVFLVCVPSVRDAAGEPGWSLCHRRTGIIEACRRLKGKVAVVGEDVLACRIAITIGPLVPSGCTASHRTIVQTPTS